MSNSIIIALSVIAVVAVVSAKFVEHNYVSVGLSISSFLLVAANIVYALLLGAELEAVLIYVLIFALIGLVSFLPAAGRGGNGGEGKYTREQSLDDNVQLPEGECGEKTEDAE